MYVHVCMSGSLGCCCVVPCGAGTYYSIELDRCLLCHPGSYQHRQAELECESCPPGTATILPGATSLDLCEGSIINFICCANHTNC